jgi:hypothetical protein
MNEDKLKQRTRDFAKNIIQIVSSITTLRKFKMDRGV